MCEWVNWLLLIIFWTLDSLLIFITISIAILIEYFYLGFLKNFITPNIEVLIFIQWRHLLVGPPAPEYWS